MGKLIVIDGLDASGKQTQCGILLDRFLQKGIDAKKISFPDYDDASSELVKMYLRGDFGNDPNAVNAYAASSFYAVDRCASFLRYWKDFYESGGVVIADRYTTSNAIHQAVKLKGGERSSFFDWLYEYEFDLLQLPRPDLVIFLDVDPEVSQKLMKDRANKFDGTKDKDIHERSKQYLLDCYETSMEAAAYLGWVRVSCTEAGEMCSVEDIASEVEKLAFEIIKKDK